MYSLIRGGGAGALIGRRPGSGVQSGSSHRQQQCHSCQDPLCGRVPGSEGEGPDVGGPADLGLVDGALVGAL